ncbi:MAG: hypothetical protein HYX53_02525 [Chloroflexi bacterium]|nr:hypothetical protein [Chloroflexota bacterium]
MIQMYVEARRTLLDALDALEPQLDSIVIVGAQAIYLHVGDADFGVAPFTTDGDLAMDPSLLTDEPSLIALMNAAGFVPGPLKGGAAQPGTWVNGAGIAIDLLVPASLGKRPGHRGADLGASHGSRAARNVAGLEGALVDKQRMAIPSLDGPDARVRHAFVAGPSGLLVSKFHKLGERSHNDPARLKDKDALDVYRLLREVPAAQLVSGFEALRHNAISEAATRDGLAYARQMFGSPTAAGVDMVVRALATTGEDPEFVRASAAALADDLFVEFD